MAVKAESVSAKQERAVRAKLSHVVKRHLAEKRLCSTSYSYLPELRNRIILGLESGCLLLLLFCVPSGKSFNLFLLQIFCLYDGHNDAYYAF